jgi:hypothetical protein
MLVQKSVTDNGLADCKGKGKYINSAHRILHITEIKTKQMNVYDLTALFCHSMLKKTEPYIINILILKIIKW